MLDTCPFSPTIRIRIIHTVSHLQLQTQCISPSLPLLHATTALCLDKSSSLQSRGHFSASHMSHICMFVITGQWIFIIILRCDWNVKSHDTTQIHDKEEELQSNWTSTKGLWVISDSNMSAFIQYLYFNSLLTKSCTQCRDVATAQCCPISLSLSPSRSKKGNQ